MLSGGQMGFQSKECLGMETYQLRKCTYYHVSITVFSGEGSPRQSFFNGLLSGFKIGSGDYLLPWLQSNCIYLGL